MKLNPHNLTDGDTISKNAEPVRCLLWGTGKDLVSNLYLIKYFEMLNKIIVYAVTSNDQLYDYVAGYQFVKKENINSKDFDVVLIMTSNIPFIKEIQQEAISIGVSESDIIIWRVLTVPGFDFSKYRKLKLNTPTIFAPNCWGGVTYNHLGLQFKSPFINMFEKHDDYIKFLTNPKYYLKCNLQFKEMQYNEILQRNFPVVKCDDILLFFNHYVTYEEAVDAWNRRKERIDWENLFVMFYDEDPHRVETFCRLPYAKKICFAPFQSDEDCVLFTGYRENKALKNLKFWEVVNRLASGQYLSYDVFDLLLYGKVTLLAKFNKIGI